MEVSQASGADAASDMDPWAVFVRASDWNVDELTRIFVKAAETETELPQVRFLQRGADPKKTLNWLLVGANLKTGDYSHPDRNYHVDTTESLKLRAQQVSEAGLPQIRLQLHFALL
jgi:hypothetical protein